MVFVPIAFRSPFDGYMAHNALVGLQDHADMATRDVIAKALAKEINRTIPRTSYPDLDQARAMNLEDDGCCTLPHLLAPEKVKELVDYLHSRPVFNAHTATYSDGKGRSIEETAPIANYGAYLAEDLIRAPHVMDLALHPMALALADHYLGCTPTIYSINAWWTFASHRTPGTVHFYHRDQDDFRFLSMFIYLTDVEDLDDGAFVYIKGTHRPWAMAPAITRYNAKRPQGSPELTAEDLFPPKAKNGHLIGLDYDTMFGDDAISVTGDRGAVFMCDSFGLHRGLMPFRRHRLALWIRYGLYQHRWYMVDQTRPVPIDHPKGAEASLQDRYMLRLLSLSSALGLHYDPSNWPG